MTYKSTLLALLAAAATLVSCDGSTSSRCTIVTDGTREVFEHERAHCMGWDHEPFEVAAPPRSYRHDFPGHLTVIQCSGSKRHKAPAGTTFVKGCRSAKNMCIKMWAERGYDNSAYAASYNYQYIAGCQFSE